MNITINMNCVICQQETKKYKCPVCREPYCSVECYKKHKETPCVAPPKEAPIEEQKLTASYDYPTEDTVPIEKLEELRHSKEVKQCLENPHLRKLLEVLDGCDQPDRKVQQYMQEPIFTEFVDACLNVIEPAKDENF